MVSIFFLDVCPLLVGIMLEWPMFFNWVETTTYQVDDIFWDIHILGDLTMSTYIWMNSIGKIMFHGVDWHVLILGSIYNYIYIWIYIYDMYPSRDKLFSYSNFHCQVTRMNVVRLGWGKVMNRWVNMSTLSTHDVPWKWWAIQSQTHGIVDPFWKSWEICAGLSTPK